MCRVLTRGSKRVALTNTNNLHLFIAKNAQLVKTLQRHFCLEYNVLTDCTFVGINKCDICTVLNSVRQIT